MLSFPPCCNGITYTPGWFARAARLMRSLGCAVVAEKRKVPVLIMMCYYPLWYRREDEKTKLIKWAYPIGINPEPNIPYSRHVSTGVTDILTPHYLKIPIQQNVPICKYETLL